MLETISSHLFLQTLALTLVHFLWQGLVVACLLKIVLSVFDHQKSQWRYGFSAIAMLANLCLPIITFVTLYQPSEHSLVNSFTLPIDSFQYSLQANNGLLAHSELAEYLPFLSLAWLVCVLFLAGKLLLEMYYVHHLPQQRVVEPTKALNNKFMALVEKVGLYVTPRLLISLKVDVPMAIGWLKPVVLIPAKMVTGLSAEQLEMLILHELAHIKRFDYLVNFFQTLIDILLFFHPCVHWVSKQMRQEREYCSDDIAVSHCGDAIAYAHTLTDTATLCRKHTHHAATIPSMAMAASGGDLKQRVVRLVHHCSGKQEQGRWFAGVLIIGAVLTFTLLPYLQLPVFDLSSGHIQILRSDIPFKNGNISEGESEQVTSSSLAQQLLFKNNTLDNASIFSPTTVAALKNKIDSVTVNNSDISNDKAALVIQPLDQHQENFDTSFNASKQTPSTNSAQKTYQKNKASIVDKKENRSDLLTSKNAHKMNSKTLNKPEAATIKPMLASTSLPLSKHTEQLKGYKKLASENKYAKQVSDIASNVNTPTSVLLDKLQTKSTKHPLLADEEITTKAVKSVLSVNDATTKKQLANARANIYEAQLISSYEPRYPAMAKRKGIELDVKVNFKIGVDGKIKDIQFEEQGKISYFRHAILVAMEKWHFQPAQTNGKPVESAMSKIFSFSLVS